MLHGYKNLPVLTSEDWKNELEILRFMTDVTEEKQALAVTLSLLSGQATAKALEIPVDRLNQEGRLTILIKALDELYLWDTVDLSYSAFYEFDKFLKTEEITRVGLSLNMGDIVDKIRIYEMVLLDILSFKLLHSSGLSQKEKQLVLTAAQDKIWFYEVSLK